MSVQVYSVLGQTKGRRKALLEWANIDLFSKLSLTCARNVNYYKGAQHPIPTLPVRIGNIFQKHISELYFQLSVHVYSLLGQDEAEREAYFGGCKKGGRIVRLSRRELGCDKR